MGLAAFAERCGRDCTRPQGGGARALLTSTPYSPSFGHTGPQDHSHKVFTALALSQEHQERGQDGVGSKAQASCNLRVWLSPGASPRSVPRLRPVSVLLPTYGGLGTSPAAVPRARYRERQLQLHPLPGHQPGSHQRAGTSGTQWGSPNKDGACNWPWGQGWTRSSWRSRGRASSHAWHTAETPGAGQPNGPGSPTAQLVGFAPSPGGSQSGSQEL